MVIIPTPLNLLQCKVEAGKLISNCGREYAMHCFLLKQTPIKKE